jgi:hypothetical protein
MAGMAAAPGSPWHVAQAEAAWAACEKRMALERGAGVMSGAGLIARHCAGVTTGPLATALLPTWHAPQRSIAGACPGSPVWHVAQASMPGEC